MDLLKNNLVILPADNFEKLPPSLKENKIVFLGEDHNVKPLADAADRLAVYLANYNPVVYAVESCYGLGPFMEAASLGNPRTAKNIVVPGNIQRFNASQAHDKNKILMTAIDIEHSIYHTKTDSVLFLQDLASRSTSDVALQEINREIAPLTAQDTYDKTNRYLENLEKVFLKHFDTFSSEDQDETVFYFDLLHASNRYQYIKQDWRTARPVRYRYYKETIRRAYRKARKREAILLCRVGSWHISSDYECEARYFARDYALTKGKVAAIRLVPLYNDAHETNDTVRDKHDDIDSFVMRLMKDSECSYLSLSDLQKGTNNSFAWCEYYSKGHPKYDGLLFVRIEKNANQSSGIGHSTEVLDIWADGWKNVAK